MATDQVWTLDHDGRAHRVVAGGGLAHVVRWYVDGELLAERKTSDDKVTLEAPAEGKGKLLDDPEGKAKLLVYFSGLGTPRRATLYAAEEGVAALTGLGGIDLLPEPGSKAAAYEDRVREHPTRYAALATAGGVAKVLVPILLTLLVVRIAVDIPWPSIPHPDLPDLPSIPWPSIPWPDLPDLPDWQLPGWLTWLLGKLKYVWPIVLAYVLARAEIRRRREQDKKRRAAQPDAKDVVDSEDSSRD